MNEPLQPHALGRLQFVRLIVATRITTLSNTTVGNLLSAGCPQNPDGTLNLINLTAWLLEDRRKKASERRAPTAKDRDMARIVSAKAEEHEMKNAIKKGNYILKTDAEDFNHLVASRLRRAFQNAIKVLGPQGGKFINEAIDRAIHDFRGWKGKRTWR